MNLFTSTPKREAIAMVEYLPAVSIVMPFTPVTTLKKNLEYSLKDVMAKVEAMLSTHYTAEKAMPIIIRLKNLFCSLNYNTHKKSIAIFVSPVVEKVFYFEIEMEEKIAIDPSFKISDLVNCKKEGKEYLVLLLSDKFSKMYLNNGIQLKLIKSNTLPDDEIKEENATDLITGKFLHQMDQGLSIILKSYPLPVFVVGSEKLLQCFEKTTKNNESIAQFIPLNCQESAEELCCLLEPVSANWRKLKQQYLLKQFEIAKTQNKARLGILDALNAVMHSRGRLLLVERSLMKRRHISKTPCNEVFFIRDEVDDIIKKVFENGGDVEFIDDGMLAGYGDIALIER